MTYEDATVGTAVETELLTGRDGRPATGRVVDRDGEMIAVKWDDSGHVGWVTAADLNAA